MIICRVIVLLFWITGATSRGLEDVELEDNPYEETPPSPWGGCVDPSNDGYEHNLIEIGKKTAVCIVISRGGNWGEGMIYNRWVLLPVADDYSYFEIADSYNDLVKQPNFYYPQISVHVESHQSLSFIRRYYDDTEFKTKVFPFLTAIIDVREGVVVGITWDHACLYCDDDRCEENSYTFNGENAKDVKSPTKGCYLRKMECDKAPLSGSQSVCALGIYFAWSGTDKHGRALTSVGSRRSAFSEKDIPKLGEVWPKLDQAFS